MLDTSKHTCEDELDDVVDEDDHDDNQERPPNNGHLVVDPFLAELLPVRKHLAQAVNYILLAIAFNEADLPDSPFGILDNFLRSDVLVDGAVWLGVG